MHIFREGGNLKLDNNDFILKIVAELEQKGIKTGFDKLKKELEKDPAKIDVILDTSGTVGKTKGSIKKLAAELHNELSVEISKLQKQGQDINFDLSVGDVEEVIQNVINHTKKLGESFDVASDKAQKFLAKFNKKSGGVLINSDEFKAVQEAINGLGNTHTIEDLNKAMNTLEVTYDNMSSKLRNSGKSLNPFINAKNEMSTMDKTIEGISLEFDKLSSKPDDVANAIKELSVQQDMVNSFTIGTMEWADAYGHLQQMIVNVTKDISNLQKAQSSKSLQPRIDEIQLSMDNGHGASKYQNRIQSLINDFQKYGVSIETAKTQTKSLQQIFNDMKGLSGQELVTQADNFEQEFKAVKISIDEAKLSYDKLLQPISSSKQVNLTNKIEKWLSNNTRATKSARQELELYLKELSSGSINQEQYVKFSNRLTELDTEMRIMGKLGKSLFQSLSEGAKKFTSWISATAIVMKVITTIRTGIGTVKELDTALVDLKKTANMSASELRNFYLSANDTAKQMGVTTKAIIEQAAAWSRLGFNTAEAATQMAKLSSQFQLISPGMTSDEAVSGLVSTMKAYDIEVNDVLDGIMSKVNVIGNNFALSNADIVAMLQDSVSAMVEGNNTLEETIALETAAFEIAQDRSVGNGFKTVALQLRGINEETQELDDSLKTIQGDLYDLTGVSIMENTDTYKSTYQILKEMSEVWDSLTDKTQAKALELMFGKLRANIGASVLKNFSAAEKAMDDMANSAGNAEAEMSVAMDSIDYKLNKVKETGTGIAQNLFGQEEMKSILDAISSIGNGLDWLTDKLGLFGSVTTIGSGIASANGLGLT